MTYQDLNISKITKITKIEKIIKNKDDDVLYNSSIKNKTPIKTSYNSGQIFSKQKGYESKHFSSKLNIFPKKLVNIDINTAEDNSSSPYIERSKTNRDLKTIDYNNYNDAKINKDSFIKKINTIPNKRMIKNNTGNLFALNKNNENDNNSDEDSYIQSSIFFPMDNILEETKNKKIDENVFNDQKHASVRKIENNNILKNHSSLNVNYMNNGMQNQKKYNHNNITNNYYLNNNIYNINYYNQYNDINTDNNNRFRINNYLIGYPFQNSYFPNNNYE
jgi:hypothetical protein